MVLKKQTVWLLTMLSLIVVLSVYYMTSPGQSDQMAYVNDNSKQQEDVASKDNAKKDEVASSISSDDQFTAYRLGRDTDRSKEIQKLQDVAASDKSSAVEVSKALDSISELQSLSSNESLLEDVIKSKGYSDAVVNTNDNNVIIYVAANALSNSDANDIMRLSEKYLGNRIVTVKYQKTTASK